MHAALLAQTDKVLFWGYGNPAEPSNFPNTTQLWDPIFWPFHAFLLVVYERWRNYLDPECLRHLFVGRDQARDLDINAAWKAESDDVSLALLFR